MQLSDTLTSVRLDIIERTIGTSPLMCLYSGVMPDSCEDADVGALLSQGSLPSDWLSGASAGSKTRFGTWTITGTAAASTGVQATYFRIKDSTGTTTHIQGSLGPIVSPTQIATWFSSNSEIALAEATAAIVKGMRVLGTGIHLGTTVTSISDTSLVVSIPPYASGTNEVLTFNSDVVMSNTTITEGQVILFNTFTLTEGV